MLGRKYRIRKDKNNRYIPETRSWDTLYLWIHVPDISGVYSMFNQGALRYYNSNNAKEVIEVYKKYLTNKEEMIKVD